MLGFMTTFFLKILFIIGIYAVFVSLFHHVTSRWLGIQKRKYFSHEMINDQHEKGDKRLGYLTVLAMISGFIVVVSTDYESRYLRPYLIIGFFFIGRLLWKSYMERKWTHDKREHTYTLMEAGFYTVLLIATFTTDVWLF
ncbi:DUF4181 domain-containing protein [Bacillus sp. AFS015802]|uniref:DUF4181 domain-containing protein n=1 Tax=Bacillus sp. AFS015802 TaxID=2033486 RepID=UPI0015CF5C95|nr:DUF4181 domain-containing protein [Bacillus sp. AFS015802]